MLPLHSCLKDGRPVHYKEILIQSFMEGECPKDLTRGIEEVVEEKGGHNWEGAGVEKGLRTLERLWEGVPYLGRSLRGRQCFPGCHARKHSDSSQALLEKQQ